MKNLTLKTRNRIARLVKKAIKLNLLSRPATCDICRKKAKIQAHHQDYTKPLDVDWLCIGCHSKVHGAAKILYSYIFHPSFPSPLSGKRHFLSLKDNRLKPI